MNVELLCVCNCCNVCVFQGTEGNCTYQNDSPSSNTSASTNCNDVFREVITVTCAVTVYW